MFSLEHLRHFTTVVASPRVRLIHIVRVCAIAFGMSVALVCTPVAVRVVLVRRHLAITVPKVGVRTIAGTKPPLSSVHHQLRLVDRLTIVRITDARLARHIAARLALTVAEVVFIELYVAARAAILGCRARGRAACWSFMLFICWV